MPCRPWRNGRRTVQAGRKALMLRLIRALYPGETGLPRSARNGPAVPAPPQSRIAAMARAAAEWAPALLFRLG